jgi:hypothetical protein
MQKKNSNIKVENTEDRVVPEIKNNSTKKFLASFMICLIILLPFYVSSAYAANGDEPVVGDIIEDDIEGDILSVLATGMEGIEDYTSTLSDDYVSLTATIIYTLDELEDNQVRIRFNGGAPLNPECTSDGTSTYTCVLEHSAYNDAAGVIEYSVTLTDQYLAIIDTFSASMYVDGLGPTVNLIVSKKPQESKISIDVVAEDVACSSGCTNKCSGIQELNLFIMEEGEALEPFHTISTFDGCDYEEDDLEFDYSSLGIDGGITEFCISGTDSVGNDNEKCKLINLDISAPIFLSDLIAMKNGQPLNYIIKDETPKVDLYLNVTDDNTLSTSSITADFTGLNPSQSGYSNRNPTSVKTYDEEIEGIEETITISEFKWTGITLNNPEGLTASISVSDIDENTADSEFTIAVNIDETPPEVGAIYTDKSILYLNDSSKNTIYVDFIEVGSGLNADEVFLDLSEISGENKKKANNCTAGDSGLYSCIWNNVNPSKLAQENPKIDVLTSLYYVKNEARIHSDTVDIAGNKISTEFPEYLTQELIFDNIAPEIISIEVSSATSQGLEAAGFSGSADDFESSGLVEDSGTDSAPGFTPETGDDTADTTAGEIDISGQAFGSSSTKAGQIITNAEEEIIILSAYVMEFGSILDPSNVLAQLNVEELWPLGPQPATSCDIVEPALIEGLDDKYKQFPLREYVYQCIWELPTIPIAGSYYFNIEAIDVAGNVYEKNTDKFKIYELVEGDADFFDDESELDIYDMYDFGYELNRNFLHMSTQTFFRMEVDLSDYRKIAGSFVHDFTIGECTAARGESFTAEDIKPVAIVSQTYLSDSLIKSREQKEIMLAIPQFEATEDELKEATKKGSKEDPLPLTIACKGEIVQSSIAGKKAYTPNEVIVFSLEIPIGKEIFSNPADSTLDKALEYKKGIDALDTIIDILKYVEYIAPYCKMINLVMQIWNNICMIYEGFGAAFAPANVAAGECKLGLDFLTKLWYGGDKGDPAKVGEVGALANQWSNKDALSLGFICDLTLCTTCSQLWGSKFTGGKWDIESWSPDKLTYSIYGKQGIDPAELNKVSGNPIDPAEYWTGSSQIRFPFDPHKNFWVALICWPPCVPTIIRTLEMVKRILVAQNTCYNKAYLLGEDIEDCSSIGWKIFCMLTFGQFMHILPDLIRQYASKLVSSLVSRLFEVGCTGVTKAERLSCNWVRVRNFIVGVLSILDLATNIRQLYEEMEETFDFGDDSEDDDKVKDEFNSQAEEFGTLPSYD